jgi:hypothetical protein
VTFANPAKNYFPDIENRYPAQLEAYRVKENRFKGLP